MAVPPDKLGMASQPVAAADFTTLAETAWLFVRGPESVRITRGPLPGANYELLIEGPRESEQRLTFSDLVACVEKQMEVEYTLLIRGFHLEELTSDRRRRHRTPFTAADRRRARALRLVTTEY